MTCEHSHKDDPENTCCHDCFRRRLITAELFEELEKASYVYGDLFVFPKDPKKRDEAIEEARRRVFKEKEYMKIKKKWLGSDDD